MCSRDVLTEALTFTFRHKGIRVNRLQDPIQCHLPVQEHIHPSLLLIFLLVAKILLIFPLVAKILVRLTLLQDRNGFLEHPNPLMCAAKPFGVKTVTAKSRKRPTARQAYHVPDNQAADIPCLLRDPILHLEDIPCILQSNPNTQFIHQLSPDMLSLRPLEGLPTSLLQQRRLRSPQRKSPIFGRTPWQLFCRSSQYFC